MGGWVAWTCAMMLAVLLFVGRAGVCVDGCRSGSCIDAGWVDVCSEVVLDDGVCSNGVVYVCCSFHKVSSGRVSQGSEGINFLLKAIR